MANGKNISSGRQTLATARKTTISIIFIINQSPPFFPLNSMHCALRHIKAAPSRTGHFEKTSYCEACLESESRSCEDLAMFQQDTSRSQTYKGQSFQNRTFSKKRVTARHALSQESPAPARRSSHVPTAYISLSDI